MYKRQLVMWAAFLAMLIFGIVMAVLGSVLPSVIVKFDISLVNAGSLFLLMSLGMLFGSLFFGPVVDRYGYKWLMLVCTALVFAGIEGIALAPSLPGLKMALVLVGFAGGAINGGANALVADISEKNRGSGLSFLGVFFGIGAFSVPFLLGSLMGTFQYESLISSVGFLVLIPLLFFSSIRFPESKHNQGFPVREGLGLIKERVLLMFGLMLFMQSGLEMVISGWSATYFKEVLNVESQEAVFLLSVYWFSLMISRLAIGNLLKKTSHVKVLFISYGIAFAGALLMIGASDKYVAVAGLALVGIGFASAFPLILAFVGNTYAKFSGTAFSLVLACGLVGGMLFPWVTGMLAEWAGLRVAFILAPASLLASALIFKTIKNKT
ncbi:MAG: MFS transporter [Bacteroidota bacterium]